MKLLTMVLLIIMAVAQTKFHIRYFSADPKSGITIHFQPVEEPGCVRMDNCGWQLRWDAGSKIGAKWDQANFEVAYMQGRTNILQTDTRTVLGSTKSKLETLWPVFTMHPATVVYIRVVILHKDKEVGRAEFK